MTLCTTLTCAMISFTVLFMGGFRVESTLAQDASAQQSLAEPNCLRIESASSPALRQLKGVRWAGANKLRFSKDFKVKRKSQNRIELISTTNSAARPHEFFCSCESSSSSEPCGTSEAGCGIAVGRNVIDCFEESCKKCGIYIVIHTD